MTDLKQMKIATLREQPWYALTIEKTKKILQTEEERGLSKTEVERRQQQFGLNKLPEKQQTSLFSVLLRQFKDPLIYILLIAGIVSLAIGNFNNAIFIIAVLVINAGIGTFQEWKAENSAHNLQSIMKIRATVQREGQRHTVDSAELVPGDIVLVQSGNAVPADMRLIDAQDLHADESLLTGESAQVDKSATPELAEDTPLGDRSNLLHAGSSIISGRGAGVVCRVGAASEVGRIAEALSESAGESPPLVVKLKKFTRQIAIIVLIAVFLLGIIQFVRGVEITQIFFLAVALAVSAIPAGLPVAITVAMAIASKRMAERNVIVRQLPAVEGLGSCTVIASDKTGTLTANKLTIKRLQAVDGEQWSVSGEGLNAEGDLHRQDGADAAVSPEMRDYWQRFATSAALSNEAEFSVDAEGNVEEQGDTVDVAFLVLAAKLGLEPPKTLKQKYPQVGFIPFESEQRFAASFNRHEGQIIAHVKGAAEALTDMCPHVDGEKIRRYEEQLAEQGYRVLAVASGPVAEQENYGKSALQNLEFLGFAGLIDPIRAEVPSAVERCHSAGVSVRMITGDHPATGLSIARRLHIADADDQAITGQDLDRWQDLEDRREHVRTAPVFARIEPTQKTEIVDDLQSVGHFVAVTGDGVNDAPALRKAHIGVAMGQSGTDVARSAADMILTDDNFASIVNGIEEGRIAYDNVRKVTWLLLSTGMAEVLLFFLALFTGLPLPLNAVQLLWLNLVTNGIQDVALAFEKGEPDILKRAPRSPDQPIFDRKMIEQTLLSGCYIGLVAFGGYYYLYEQVGMGEVEARNLLLLLMVLFENMHAFSCRSETRSLFSVPLRANPLLILSVITAQGVHIAAMYIPGLSDVLGIHPVELSTWLTLLGIAVSLLLFDEVAKWIHRKRVNRSSEIEQDALLSGGH